MEIPDEFAPIIRRLVRQEYLEKQHQTLLVERTYSVEHPDTQRAHVERDPVARLLILVDPAEAERLQVAA